MNKPMRVVILEDDRDRCEAMRTRLEDRFPNFTISFFNAVQPMVQHLVSTNLEDLILISLDHDLDLLPGSQGDWLDPGTGVDIALWLSEQEPVCPVVVHTTNSHGGHEMEQLLRHAGWNTKRVVPYEGTTWINECWFPLVRNEIVASALPQNPLVPECPSATTSPKLADETSA